ncbi:MAG: two-component regulator propeller domain-containing protein, partial [Bacteroidia bacterium]
MIRLILLLSIILNTLNSYSQQYYFARYTLNDGLPHSRVNDIHQGKEGYLWLATNMGLSRFDGSKFLNYSFKDGLSDNKVTCILELDTSKFLLGHENGELSYFELGREIKKIQLLKNTNRIFNLMIDSENFIWISTQGSGAFKIKNDNLIENFESNNYEHFDADNGLARDVTSILEDSHKNMWFLTDLGIKRKLRQEKEFNFFLPKGIDLCNFP